MLRPTPHTRWRWGDPRDSSIGLDIARFVDPAARTIAPCPAFVDPPQRLGPVPAGWSPRPRFATRASCSIVRVPIAAGTDLYATGEVAGPLRRNSTRTVCDNFDAYGYNASTPSLYQSHPWVLAVARDGSALGMLIETTYRCTIDLHRAIRCVVQGPPPAVTIIRRDHPRAVIEALSGLIGTMPMPPRWALGFQQSRYSYTPADRVRQIARTFRDKRLPCDVIWMDIDYMDSYRVFSFNPQTFPDPAALNADLHALGFHSAWMIDPGIKVDPDDPVYHAGCAGDHFLRDASGSAVRGEVWPGACAFPDFTRRTTRDWWGSLYSPFLATGVDGVWNDMNEPTVFDDGPRRTLDDGVRHNADDELGGQGDHARYHNIYGMQMVRASRAGMLAARPDARPFLLTRANFLGGHRYAATWTGDNLSTWEHLRWSIPMALNMGLSGQPFVGPDIGGFGGNATGELFARWMGIGTLLPFARAHSAIDTNDHEPWAFGEAVERSCRLALQRRMRLLPYLYTLFEEASRTGAPIVRPVFFADPRDERLRRIDDSFLLGDALLVRARVCEHGQSRSPMPRGVWHRLEPVGEPSDPALDALPELLVRAGSIIPLGPVMQHTGEAALDPLTLAVCPDEHGKATGELYEDAGDGWDHETGSFCRTRFEATTHAGEVHIATRRIAGDWPVADRTVITTVLRAPPSS